MRRPGGAKRAVVLAAIAAVTALLFAAGSDLRQQMGVDFPLDGLGTFGPC
jgi:hypothetical protein